MRLLLIWLLTAAVAAGLAALAIEDPGSVLIVRGDYTLRLSLALLVILLLVALMAVYFLVWLTQSLLGMPRKLRAHSQVRGERKVAEQLTEGYLALLAGESTEAENLLKQVSESSVLGGLGAAWAASVQGSDKRVDGYLKAVRARQPERALMADFAKARLALASGSADAKPILARLIERRPNNPLVARLFAEACEREQDWPALLKLLPALEKLGALPKQRLQAISASAYRGYFQTCLKPGEAWNKLAAKSRRRAAAIAGFAGRLIKDNQMEQAERLLTESIQNMPAAPDKTELGLLTGCYAELGGESQERRSRLEGWLKRFGEEPGLLLALARAHWRADNPDAARAVYRRLAEQSPAGPAWVECAQMEESLGDLAAALKCWHAYHKAKSTEN